MAPPKTADKMARGKMSQKTPNNKNDKRSANELRDERRLRRGLEKTTPRTTDDHNNPRQMSQRSRQASHRSKALGKRKREHEEDDTEQPRENAAAQNKECTVCLELMKRNSFPIIQHSIGGEHGSDVCLSCWD